MSAETATPRPYTPGYGEFVIVLACLSLLAALIEIGSMNTPPPAAPGWVFGTTITFCVVAALVGAFMFWFATDGLGSKVILPALSYGAVLGMVTLGHTSADYAGRHPDFRGAGMTAVGYTGALIGALYLLQFVGRWRASTKSAA